MIDQSQLPKLVATICATADSLGTQITPAAAAMMANDLAGHDFDAVCLALAECRRTLKGRFALSDVITRIAARDGRPSRDEAWSIALSSQDESDTVVMTPEIQLALAAARPVLDIGDKVGARMAFLSAYDRYLEEARADGSPVTWLVSLGFDPQRRDVAIRSAVQLKRLPAEKAQLFLEQILDAPVTQDGAAIAGLLSSDAPKVAATPAVRSKLAEIRKGVLAAKGRKEELRSAETATRRADFESRLAEHMRLVASAEQSQARGAAK
ncbi:hypothetical protein PHLH8_20830 [Pseudomonas sp. Pc102]|uniref:hypothetical protein n=1 Tax=Pseudomonas sp. Pc102 TaxID=2678261 RepID=UPI001BCFE6B6|nr:hypothetical protein [Pseudomonas sp. Pc102]BBP82441.1 hypothetical protein PHLH8_20830 [Pseudomonas sp. Pc102]